MKREVEYTRTLLMGCQGSFDGAMVLWSVVPGSGRRPRDSSNNVIGLRRSSYFSSFLSTVLSTRSIRQDLGTDTVEIVQSRFTDTRPFVFLAFLQYSRPTS
jgi:hypothetical protein